MKTYKKIIVALIVFTPVISMAALSGLQTLLYDFRGMLNLITQIIFGLSLIFFFWGGAQFILNDAANDKTREDGKKKMLWGVIALFVMFSIYGILRVVGNLTGIPTGGSPTNTGSGLYTPQQGGYTIPIIGS